MFPELRPGESPGLGRISLGILLMLLVSMWTFVVPGVRAAEPAQLAITEVVQEEAGAVIDAESVWLEVNNPGSEVMHPLVQECLTAAVADTS